EEAIMSWFAAHLVLYVKLREEPQDHYPLWENIILIKADSADEAFAKAEQRGREDAAEDKGFRWAGKPARWVFAGVRKLTSCQDPERRPGDGTEISFLEMEVGSEEAINKLMNGEPMSCRLREKFSILAPGQ